MYPQSSSKATSVFTWPLEMVIFFHLVTPKKHTETGQQLCHEVIKTLLKEHFSHGTAPLEVLPCLFA